MTVYVSHGEKGGVGKSRLAMVLVDYIQRQGRPVVIVEGDKSGADVGKRYGDQIETGFINLNRPDAMEEAFSNFGGWIEDHAAGADVVVNLPGQASDTLDQFAGLLADALALAGQDLVVFYSVGPLDIHTKNLVDSIERGLLSAAPPERRIVVLSEISGPTQGFHWSKSKAREQFLADGGLEGIMPVLKPTALEKSIRQMTGGYSPLIAKSSPLKIADRALLFRWLSAAHAVVALGVPRAGE